MAGRLAAIYRYPVKGLSPERLDRVSFSPGECLPEDRRFAVALPTTEFDPDRPVWLAKTHFVMLMRDARLAELKTRFDADTGELTVEQRGGHALRAKLTDTEDRQRLAAFLDDFLGGSVSHPLRVVEAPGHAFADARRRRNATTDKYVSLINLNSIAALERTVEQQVDPLRFRANFYFAGMPEWSELDWVEQQLTLGGARLRVVSPITRCAATQVNLQTAERDIDVPAALQRGFGHNLMGVYAEVVTGAEVGEGDPLSPVISR